MDLPINIVFCCDDVYAAKLAVSAYSLLHNCSSPVALYVIDCGISVKNQQLICSLQEKCDNLVSIQFKQPETIACFEEFPVGPWLSSAIFYRLSIPQIFPMLTRAIYLDCDVIVDDDISDLWDMDLGGCSFSALNDEGNFFLSDDIERRKRLAGIPLDRTYMSSGALLIDLPRFVDARILERVIAVVNGQHGTLACPEQDAVNICIGENEYVPLDLRYNFAPFAKLAKKRVREGIRPVVIHYSSIKPWALNKHLVNGLYKLRLFRYDLGFIKKYWQYSDEIDPDGYSSCELMPTLKFLYKRTFGPIEYFVAKKVRNKLVRFFKQLFPKSRRIEDGR